MKKMMTIAEVELIRLDADDIIVTSMGDGSLGGYIDPSDDNDGNNFAPSRWNYRGAAVDWDDQDW